MSKLTFKQQLRNCEASTKRLIKWLESNGYEVKQHSIYREMYYVSNDHMQARIYVWPKNNAHMASYDITSYYGLIEDPEPLYDNGIMIDEEDYYG